MNLLPSFCLQMYFEAASHGWSCSDASGGKRRGGVGSVDMLKPKGRAAAHQAYIPGKMRPHQPTELLPPQMPVRVGLQSAEE